MDNPAPLELHLAKFRTGARSLRFTRVLGRDWKIAFLFVLPMVLLMVGLIFWPFISAILMSTTTLQLPDRRDRQRRAAQLPAPVHQQRLPAVAAEHDQFHVLVARHQVRHRHDHRADPQQPLPLREPAVGNHAAALDRAGDRHRARLEEHLRSAVRRPQSDPAGPRHHRPAARLAVRSADGDGQRHRGERLEGHSLLHAAAARRPQGHRQRAATRRPRSTAPTPSSGSATSRCRACATSSSSCCCCRSSRPSTSSA